jgi:hypothetical protein
MSHVQVSNRGPGRTNSVTATIGMGGPSTWGLGGDQQPITKNIKKAGNEILYSASYLNRVFRIGVGNGILGHATDMACE